MLGSTCNGFLGACWSLKFSGRLLANKNPPTNQHDWLTNPLVESMYFLLKNGNFPACHVIVFRGVVLDSLLCTMGFMIIW